MKKISQRDLVFEYFLQNPYKKIEHPEVVDWVVVEYKRRTGQVFRDPDRAIRKLHQEGFLVKIQKGIYLYDPDLVKEKVLEDFTEKQKKLIKKRDNYQCVICGKGIKDGVELHVDHIKPKDLGGKATLENGQTLCSQHNFFKKNLKQTETGKKMFIRLYQLAKKENNIQLFNFCKEILEIYEKNNMNGHIIWEQ